MRLALLVAAGSTLLLVTTLGGCAATVPQQQYDEVKAENDVNVIELDKKTQALMETSQQLGGLRETLDEQRRRLTRICTDYPQHEVCAPQTAATYARKAFCEDKTFVQHVDEVVKACHQGQCKQVDQAELLTRAQYMSLVSRLPHSLVLFGNAKTQLDKADQTQLQQFIEQVQGEKGYVIIVGRASKDGSFKHNIRLALDRANNTREFIVGQLGLPEKNVGYITYGHPKMYLTKLDADRLSQRELTAKQANRSAFVFAYPCHGSEGAVAQ